MKRSRGELLIIAINEVNEKMSNRRREAKFKYCHIPDGEDLLAILGSAGIRSYGCDENGRILHSHFHNLLEIGICRRGKGTLIFQNEKRFYTENSIYETGISAKINLSDKTGIYTDFYIAHQKLGEKSDD